MTLRVGAAEVDITPANTVGVYLGGFGFNRKSTGLHEPLVAAALYVEHGDSFGRSGHRRLCRPAPQLHRFDPPPRARAR